MEMGLLSRKPGSDLDSTAIYAELGEYERHFNRIQSVYRGLAPTWFIGTFAGIAFLYSTDFSDTLPISRASTSALIALAGGTGITLLWLLDVFVYHRLLVAVVETASYLEVSSEGCLPALRRRFGELTQRFNVRRAVSIFYSAPTGLLCLTAGAFAFQVEPPAQKAVLVIATALLFVLGTLRPLWIIRPPRCELLLVCGLPGAGKTKAASLLAKARGLEHLSSDTIRKRMGERGRYSDEDRKRVYDAMLEQAGAAIQNGRPVVLDATFDRRAVREEAKRMAARHSVPVRLVEIRCSSEEIVRERLSRRHGDDSEADFATYLKIKQAYDPIREPHIIVDNCGPEKDLEEWLRTLV